MKILGDPQLFPLHDHNSALLAAVRADFSGGKDVSSSLWVCEFVKMTGKKKLKHLQRVKSLKWEEILYMSEDSKALCSTRQNCLRVTFFSCSRTIQPRAWPHRAIAHDNYSYAKSHWHTCTSSGSGGNLLVAKTGISTLQCRHTPRATIKTG